MSATMAASWSARMGMALVVLLGSASAALRAQSLPPLLGAVEIAAGGRHSCARLSSGEVRCWGDSSGSQLGQPGSGRWLFATPAVELGGSAIGLALGDSHSCAILSGGSVRCWGRGDNGQRGNGDFSTDHTAVEPVGLGTGVLALSAGAFHTCAVSAAGAALCWGENGDGQLGNGGTQDSNVPVVVSGLASGVIGIAAGPHHSCALLSGGGVRCWGKGDLGQLGQGSNNSSTTPVVVSGLSSAVNAVFVAGSRSCARYSSGGFSCWGRNGSGELGDGTGTDSNLPVAASGLSSDTGQLSLGFSHSCLRSSSNGELKCWGTNTNGQHGRRADLSINLLPATIPGFSDLQDLATGREHSCVIDGDGQVLCFGSNLFGQLGDGSRAARAPTAVALAGQGAISQISAGDSHTCAVRGSAAECWGFNFFGQLGDGSTLSRFTPAAVGGPLLASKIAAGNAHSCAVTDGGGVKCWGNNQLGALGNGSTIDSATPVDANGLPSGVIAVTTGANHSCALLGALGHVQCWGLGNSGQLGTNNGSSSLAPVTVSGLSGITVISSHPGAAHTCAVNGSGGVVCWGANGSGQLGDGSTTTRLSPVGVVGLASGVAKVSVGAAHSCALLVGGGVKCWGLNTVGALGDGSTTASSQPVAVSGIASGASAISAGLFHSCAIVGGEVFCWGNSFSGENGDLGGGFRVTPFRVDGLPGPASAISAGSRHSCALVSGAAWCWGSDQHGQIGDDGRDYSLPAAVLINDAPRQVATVTPAANSASLDPQSDASGRFVVFQSSANNLLGTPDSNGAADIFRVDLQSGDTVRISVNDDESETTGDAIEPSVSGDGQLIVFVAADAALDKLAFESKRAREARQKGAGFGVFLRNMRTLQTQRLGNATPTGQGTQPQLAPDGGAVVFTTPVNDPMQGATGQNNVFHLPLLRNGDQRLPGVARCVTCKSVSSMGLDTGGNADGDSRNAVVSADGTVVAFETVASNPTVAEAAPCPAGSAQIMLRNLSTGVLRRVSPPSDLAPMQCGVSGSTQPSLDYAGLNIAFQSDQGLKPGVVPGLPGVYVASGASFDRQRISETSAGTTPDAAAGQPIISGDGRSVAFVSAATNLDTGFVDSNGRADVHVARNGRIERLSRSTLGAEADADSGNPALNYNATRLLFDSPATNLVGGDGNGQRDVFQRVIPASTDLVFATSFE